MKARRLLLLRGSVAVAACATPMAVRDIQAIKPNCSRIDKQIAMREREKAENDQRFLAGIQSVAPALAVLSLMRGTYGQNVASRRESGPEPSIRKLAELLTWAHVSQRIRSKHNHRVERRSSRARRRMVRTQN